VVIDEGVTTGRSLAGAMGAAAPHDWLAVMGGAIGWGLPGAVGAALGAPGRPVLALEGDGSAMYTLQALVDDGARAAARGGAGVRQPRLPHPAGRAAGRGRHDQRRQGGDMLSLERPALDWVALARGHGVPGVRVESGRSAGEAALRDGFCQPRASGGKIACSCKP
jgi:acetolactate synthase-1/2/3 large subunit